MRGQPGALSQYGRKVPVPQKSLNATRPSDSGAKTGIEDSRVIVSAS